MIHYALPAAAKNANLDVFNIDGALVRSFDLQAGSTAVRWDYAKDKVAAGVYVASLRYGEAEKNIQISVVK
jgi:hypothetical protein